MKNLCEFIEDESLLSKTQPLRIVVETYMCTLWKGFFDMKHKLCTITKLNQIEAVKNGITLIDNIFWIIYNHSSNLQLTIFLTERGRLLYTEFLYLSRTHDLMKDVKTLPDIKDGFAFAIRKSVGSLSISENHPSSVSLQEIMLYRNVMRCIFQTVNHKYMAVVDHHASPKWEDDDINVALHTFNHRLTNAMCGDIQHFYHKIIGDAKVRAWPLNAYLLYLYLWTDSIAATDNRRRKNAPHHPSQESVYNFVKQRMDTFDTNPYDIKCLDTAHPIQKQWRAECT